MDNYIKLESKLKDCFKVLENGDKTLKPESNSICPVGTFPNILYGNSKECKTVISTTPKSWPIISTIILYLLAKYSNPILYLLTNN